MDWFDIGPLDDIPRLGARTLRVRGEDVAVFRTATDAVFALYDECPHKRGKLSQGIVHGDNVTCPLHGLVISLSDGRARPPDEGCARRLPVRLDGRRVMMRVEEEAGR